MATLTTTRAAFLPGPQLRCEQSPIPAQHDTNITIRNIRHSERGTSGSETTWGALSGGIAGAFLAGIGYALWEIRQNGLHIQVVEDAFIAATAVGFIIGAIIGGAWRGSKSA